MMGIKMIMMAEAHHELLNRLGNVTLIVQVIEIFSEEMQILKEQILKSEMMATELMVMDEVVLDLLNQDGND